MFNRIGIGAVLLLAVAACQLNITRGSGTMATETRDVGGFSAVQLAWYGDLAITQNGAEGLTIEAEDNLLPLITTKVEGDTLVIGLDERATVGAVVPTKPVKYSLRVKELESINLSGAGNIAAPALTSTKLNLVMSGAGDIDLNQVLCEQLITVLNGAGSISLNGKVDTQSASMSGLGNYNAGDLESADATVTVDGAGSATVWAEQTLDVKISGAGNVSYYGSPQVTQSISGAGGVKPLGSK